MNEFDLRQRIVDVIVKALEPYDIPTGSWTSAEKAEPAEAILRALGLEVDASASGPSDEPGRWTTYATYRLRGLEHHETS